MPYRVEHRGDQWVITNTDTGKVVGHSDTKEDAEASVRARLGAEHGMKAVIRPAAKRILPA